MGEKAQINLRVDPAQKARWEEDVEESEQFVTVSGLIRPSVEAQLHNEQPSQQEPTPPLASDMALLNPQRAWSSR